MASQRLIESRYLLQGRLGSGAAGTVWRATDEVLGRAVAIKEIHRHLAGDDDSQSALARERAIREARATAALRHPHIVPIYDVISGDEFPWIVMELIDGVSLKSLVNSSGPLDPYRVVQIGLALLDALEAAHRAGIVHRDVKPANVLLGHDDGVWLTDFGIAHVLGDATVTESGIALGTPGYLAPEQARGERAGPEADVFGLAATLYYAVEGVGPFESETPVGALGAVVFSPPRPPIRAESLGQALVAMLDKDPAARPSIAQVRGELVRALPPRHRSRVAAAPPAPPRGNGSTLRRCFALIRRTGQFSPTIAVAAVVALAVTAVTLHNGRPAGNTPASGAPTTDSAKPRGGGPPRGGQPGPGLHHVASIGLPAPLSGGQVTAARDDSLYVADGRRLLAFNLATGGQRWSAESPTGPVIRLAVTRETVAVHSTGPDATTSAGALFRSVDGRLIWRRDGGVVGLAQLPGGLLFVQREDAGRRGHSVIAADGSELWTSDGPSYHFRGAGAEDLVLEWTSAGTARVRRAANGQVVASGPAGALSGLGTLSGPTNRAVDGTLIGASGGQVIGVDPVSRAERWRIRRPGTPIRCTGRLVCLHDPGAGRMTAIEARTGAEKWVLENAMFRAEGYGGLEAPAADMPAINDRVILVRGNAVAVVHAGNGSVIHQDAGRSILLDERHLLVLRPSDDRTAPNLIHLLDGHARPLEPLSVQAAACAATMRYLACPTSGSALDVWALPPPPPGGPPGAPPG